MRPRVVGLGGRTSDATDRSGARGCRGGHARATSAQVAAAFNLSRGCTVGNHLQHVFRKLGISRREELAAYLTRMDRKSPSGAEPRPTH